MRCKCGRKTIMFRGKRVRWCGRHIPEYVLNGRAYVGRGPSPLFVMPDTPEIIEGHEALEKAIDRDAQFVSECLSREFDPIPARWTLHGLQAQRVRLELWCARQPYKTEPKEGIAVLRGEGAIAKAVGMSPRALQFYIAGKDGRISPPIVQPGQPLAVWCYTDALQDWVTSLSMSFVMRVKLRNEGKLLVMDSPLGEETSK